MIVAEQTGVAGRPAPRIREAASARTSARSIAPGRADRRRRRCPRLAGRPDPVRERIAAYHFPRGGVEVVRANRGYTLYSRRTGGPVARLRPTGDGDRVQVLWWRGDAWGAPGDFGRSSCRSTRPSRSSPPKGSSGSKRDTRTPPKRARTAGPARSHARPRLLGERPVTVRAPSLACTCRRSRPPGR